MRRALRTVALAGGLVAALSSCGGSETPRQTVDIEATDPTGAEVVFWYQHTTVRETALLELIDEFNRVNPHQIRVRGEFAGQYGDIYNKMLVGLQGGSLPNVVVAYQNQAREYWYADGLVDLAPFMTSPRWGLTAEDRADYIQAFMKQDFIEGAQICFPPNRSIEILYYNEDWLRELGYREPPDTWEVFAAMCRAAARQPFSRSREPGRSLGYLFEADASRMATMVFSRGGDLMSQEGTTYALDSSEMVASLELMQELVRDGAIDLLSEPYADQSEFAVGTVLFIIRSSSGLPFLTSAVEDGGLAFEWDVAAPPHSGADPVVNAYGASLSVCRATPEQELASWLFLKWFTAPAQQARWVRASNYFPVRRSTARELEEYFEQNPKYRQVYELLDYGKYEPSVAGYQPVRRMIQEAMVQAFNGGDVKVITTVLNREANAILDEYK